MDKGVPIFLKDTNPEVNVIAWLEFKFAYYNVVVHHVSHSAMGDSALKEKKNMENQIFCSEICQSAFL